MTHNYCLGNKYLVWFTALCTTTVQINLVNAKMNGLTVPSPWFTGKSLSEALIFASTNPQYDNRLFIALQVEYMKIPSSKLGRTCCVQKLFLTFRTIFVHVFPMFCKKKSFWQRFTCRKTHFLVPKKQIIRRKQDVYRYW